MSNTRAQSCETCRHVRGNHAMSLSMACKCPSCDCTRFSAGKGVAPPRPPIPEEQLRLARERAEDGMPLTWATEGFERGVKDFREALKMGTPPEWNAVRQSIHRNPALLALHKEFAPAGKL